MLCVAFLGQSFHRGFSGWKAAVWGVLLVGLSLRVGAIFYLQSYRRPYGYEHARIARNVVQGRGFSIRFLGSFGPTSQQAPWYPGLLAVAYRMAGCGTEQAHLAVQLLQAAAGTWSCWLLMQLVLALLPRHRGLAWTSGAAMALDPAQVVAATHLQVVVWVQLALLGLLYRAALALRGVGHRGVGAGVRLGLWCGWAVLVDPILALATVAGWMCWLRGACWSRGAGTWITRAGRAALPVVVAWAVVLPWLWRNRVVHGQWVFVKSTFGYAFWQGNNPWSLGTDRLPKGPAPPAWPGLGQSWRQWWEELNQARAETLYIDDVLLKPTGYRSLASLNEPQRSARLGRMAWRWVREHPGEYLRLCAYRLAYFVYADWTHPKAATGPYQVRSAAFLLLGCWGLWSLGKRGRALWPLWMVLVAIMAFHVLTIYAPRFRMAVEPLWMVAVSAGVMSRVGLAAAAVKAMKRRFSGQRGRGLRDEAACGAGACLASGQRQAPGGLPQAARRQAPAATASAIAGNAVSEDAATPAR